MFHPLSSLSLFGEGQSEYMKVLCSINTSLYLSGPVFDPRSSLSLLEERETASDRIYEGSVFDPCSTQLALYNSTSNHVGGKEAISVHSNYLNILDVGERFCIFLGRA